MLLASWSKNGLCVHYDLVGQALTSCSTYDLCHHIGWNCVDPSASDYAYCPGMDNIVWGDGYCDMWYHDLTLHLNTAICGWDGGDCCPSTCSTESGDDCDNPIYDCLDPNATDYGTVSSCQAVAPSLLGDAICDSDSDGLNTASCGWDGGDCCEVTCVDTKYAACANTTFECLDPSDPMYTCEVANMSFLGDGYCDAIEDEHSYNTKSCNWDGGDCCWATCDREADTAFECGIIGACIPPCTIVSSVCFRRVRIVTLSLLKVLCACLWVRACMREHHC